MNNFIKKHYKKVLIYFVMLTMLSSGNIQLQLLANNNHIVETENITRLVSNPHGISVDFPADTTFDFRASPRFIRAYGDGFIAVISREWSVMLCPMEYIDNHFYRFLLDERFHPANGTRITEHFRDNRICRIRLVIYDWPEDLYDGYTYLTFFTGTRFFYRIMIKYHQNDYRIPYTIQQIENSFRHFTPVGRPVYDLDFYPILPDYWTPETQELFNQFLDPDTFLWGIFVRRVVTEGIFYEIPQLEEAIGKPFDIVLGYAHLPESFPIEFMEYARQGGRVIQLTYQLTNTNNLHLYGKSPLLEFIRNGDCPQIRAFARDAAEWGHPFLFRLNNEMNSDWVSYGAPANLLDPDLFILTWRMIYNIFREEGVNNAIWIWNPQDKDAPPNGWNSYIAYYPGNQYVHMFGITGYNTGTHYADIFGETWREFQEIYDFIVNTYDGMFDAFPWIITEFGSSSIGGCKVTWIDNMFKALPNFPQIRAAVWFSYADWDFRYPYGEVVARPYWLDETPETLEAFRRGRMG